MLTRRIAGSVCIRPGPLQPAAAAVGDKRPMGRAPEARCPLRQGRGGSIMKTLASAALFAALAVAACGGPAAPRAGNTPPATLATPTVAPSFTAETHVLSGILETPGAQHFYALCQGT